MQFVLGSGIDIRSRAINASIGAMQDISNAALVSAKKIVNSVRYYITESKFYICMVNMVQMYEKD